MVSQGVNRTCCIRDCGGTAICGGDIRYRFTKIEPLAGIVVYGVVATLGIGALMPRHSVVRIAYRTLVMRAAGFCAFLSWTLGCVAMFGGLTIHCHDTPLNLTQMLREYEPARYYAIIVMLAVCPAALACKLLVPRCIARWCAPPPIRFASADATVAKSGPVLPLKPNPASHPALEVGDSPA